MPAPKILQWSIYALYSLAPLLAGGQALASAPEQADATGAGDMALFFSEEEMLVSATKHALRISEAPAIANVITAEQIRNMGARDIMDVLRTIPGIGVTRGPYGREEVEDRGLKTTNNAER